MQFPSAVKGYIHSSLIIFKLYFTYTSIPIFIMVFASSYKLVKKRRELNKNASNYIS